MRSRRDEETGRFTLMATVLHPQARAGRATSTRATARRVGGRAVTYLVVALVGLLFLFPFAWLVATSLKTDREIFAYPPTMYPHAIRWANYAAPVSYTPFLRSLVNRTMFRAGNAMGDLSPCSLTAR